MNWTSEWPTKQGHYWLYGWCFRDGDMPAQFYCVDVWKLQNGFAYVTEEHFLYKQEGAGGIGQPIQFPEPPEGQGA